MNPLALLGDHRWMPPCDYYKPDTPRVVLTLTFPSRRPGDTIGLDVHDTQFDLLGLNTTFPFWLLPIKRPVSRFLESSYSLISISLV